MTSSQPVRPNPYIVDGDGWTITVRVPGHGVWRRNPMHVSMNYAVFNQDGRDYHITIDSGYVSNPASPTPNAPLNTHITSNAPVGGRVLHWPNPGVLSVPQQAWMDQHNNTNQFATLIADFEARIRLCATNVRLSRAYDQAMDLYRAQRFQAAASKRAAKAGFREDLADWVDACPSETYVEAFKDKDEWCVLDLDRGMVVRLAPKPQPVRQGDGLSPGFVNLCEAITGSGTTLTDAHWRRLSARLTLLRVGKTDYAMLKAEFDVCPQADGLLCLDQVVELAVVEWTQAVASGKEYTKVASDKTVMNVIGPDSSRRHLKVLSLLDLGELAQHGTTAAGKQVSTLQCVAGLPGVYAMSCVPDLMTKLPPAARVSRKPQADVFILHEQVFDDWSAELEKASSVDPVALAASLLGRNAGCQVFAENLLVGEQDCMTVYLRGYDERGPAFYIGPHHEAIPDVPVTEGQPLSLHSQAARLKVYFDGGLSSTAAARNPEQAIVVCDSNRKAATPLIFVDKSTLVVLDLTKARTGFAVKLQERQEAEKAAAAKTAAAITIAKTEYSDAWKLIAPGLGSSEHKACLRLYATPAGALVAVLPGSHTAATIEAQAKLIGEIWFARGYKKTAQSTWWTIEYECSSKEARVWTEQLAEYIKTNKPDLPGNIKGYLVSAKK